MRAGKKLAHQKSGSSCLPKTETRSKPNLSLQFKKGSKSHSKRHKPKAKSFGKTSSTVLKRKVTDSLSKGKRNDSTSRKLISRKVLHKTLRTKSSKKLSSLGLQGEKSPLISSDGIGKSSDVGVKLKKLKKNHETERQKDNVEQDQASRLQRRTRYLLIKMKLEQNLIDAYSREGWKGQSREKIKPEKELERAQKQILKFKLGIRDAIHQLDLLSSEGCIEDSVIAPDGSIYHEHIICAKCKLREACPDNDIILCDGTCNCAFHQKCLDPPLNTENIPPGDQGWFCKFCECKMEILEAVNAHLGTCFSVNSNWQDIFKEEAAFPDNGSALLNPEQEWPSDDSEDDDYNPERRENSCSISGASTDGDASDDMSGSTSLSWSLDSEDFQGSKSLEEEVGMGYKNQSIYSSVDSDETTDGEIICGRRQRRDVDYRKLHDEMFGKDAPAVSEDEDWGPATKKGKEKESDAASTLMTLYGSEKKCQNVEIIDVKKKLPSDPQINWPFIRIPSNAVERLRQVFAENELPSRAVKESLSKELGLAADKVSKWFKNARYLALKTRKAEGEKELHSSTHRISNESSFDSLKKRTADFVTLKDTSTGTVVQIQKTSKSLHWRKSSKSLMSPLNKKQHSRAPLGSTANGNKVIMEFGDNVSLKKQIKLLKANAKREKKRVNSMARAESEAAEVELERLCRIKNRVESIKQTLLRLQNDKFKKSNKPHLYEQSVIYVPIAVIREKI